MNNHFIRYAVIAVCASIIWGANREIVSASDSLPNLVTTLGNLPPPALDSSGYGLTAIRFSPGGLLYAWDAQNVWRQTGVNADSFTNIGYVPTTGADPGPINFSQDGSTIMVGNGFGGTNYAGNGYFYTMPVTGGTANIVPGDPVLSHFDLAPLPAAAVSGSANMFLVDAGVYDPAAPYSGGSVVMLYNSSTGQATTVVQNIHGASTSIGFDSQNRLYVGIGDGDQQGAIQRYDLSAVVSAITTNTPIDWSAAAPDSSVWFNQATNNSGLGMFFDVRGYMFVGGPNGITVFDKNGVAKPYTIGAASYSSVTYNPANDQFAVQNEGSIDPNVYIYNAGAFGFHSTWSAGATNSYSAANWDAGLPNGVGAAAAFGQGTGDTGSPATLSVTVDSPVTLGSLMFDSTVNSFTLAGDGMAGHGITLDNGGSGAEILVNSGHHTIRANLTLADAGRNTINVSDGTSLMMTGAVAESGNGKSLIKMGAGTLELDGPLTLQSSSTLAVNGGTLRIKPTDGTQTIGADVAVTVTGSATLELAGAASALSSTNGGRVAVQNNSSAAAGILVSSAGQVLGGIDGGGNVVIADGASLTADHINQNALTIGAGAVFTLAPSDANGNPLGQESGTLLATLIPTSSITGAKSGLVDAGGLAAPAPVIALGGTNINAAAVPEPSSVALILTALSLLAFYQKWIGRYGRPIPRPLAGS